MSAGISIFEHFWDRSHTSMLLQVQWGQSDSLYATQSTATSAAKSAATCAVNYTQDGSASVLNMLAYQMARVRDLLTLEHLCPGVAFIFPSRFCIAFSQGRLCY
jgi:hypothetical protein